MGDAWRDDLERALFDGDPEYMKAMMARVPKDTLHLAVRYLHEAGKGCFQEGKYADAVTYYDQAVSAGPDDPDLRAERAETHLALKQFEPALADGRRLEDLEPESGRCFLLQGEALWGLERRGEAMTAFKKALQKEPDHPTLKEKINKLQREIDNTEMLQKMLDPEAAEKQETEVQAPQPPPKANFDPNLFVETPNRESLQGQPMFEGLRQHLSRYAELLTPGACLARLDDPRWLEAWDQALTAVKGKRVLFWGSELGVLALKALSRGAKSVIVVEPGAFAAKIGAGIVQKNRLIQWFAEKRERLPSLSEEEKKAAFEAYCQNIQVVGLGKDGLAGADLPHRCDLMIFPNIDHGLLGTGLVSAVQQCRQHALTKKARILPAKARLWATVIQWRYPGRYKLEPMNAFRWSFYPEPLDLPRKAWRELCDPIAIGDIDFNDLHEGVWDVKFPIHTRGRADAVLFWFKLDLGHGRLENDPDSGLRCLKPAHQHLDPITAAPGKTLSLKLHVKQGRLHFQPLKPLSAKRSAKLPSWYMPMVLDQARNTAFEDAIDRTLKKGRPKTILEVGAGCGLLSMMAAPKAAQVYACEVIEALCRAGEDVLRLNGFDDKVTFLQKDVRHLKYPGDLRRKADLVIMEVFDCGLIGEGALHFLEYARQNLAKAKARYLPMAAKIHAMLIEYRRDTLDGIDVNLLNPYRFSPSYINVHLREHTYKQLSEPFEVFAFDFAKAEAKPEEKELLIPVAEAGVAGAVVFWFDLQLDKRARLSNHPLTGQALHWGQALQFMKEIQVKPDTNLPLRVKHDGSGIVFQWKEDDLPKEAFSQLPRFDPQWMARSMELDQHMQQMMHHCHGHADEYRKVAELAALFAVDPAGFDLDPTVAQRFASSFFMG